LQPIHPEKSASDWFKFFIPSYFAMAFVIAAFAFGAITSLQLVFYSSVGITVLATGLLLQEYRPEPFAYIGRNIYHSVAGVLIVSAALYFVFPSTLLLLIGCLFIFFLVGWTLEIMNVETMFSIHHIRWHVKDFNKSTHYEAGTLWLLGILILLLFFDPIMAYASILVFSLGDASAAFIGKNFGKMRIPYNQKKTVEGSFGFFATSVFAALLFLPSQEAILVAALAAVVESLPLGFNDNFTVPVSTGVIISVLRAIGI
jgi:phosphoserine phosphatase